MAKNNYWYSMHELSRMDDETGDPMTGDRRHAHTPVGFTVRSGGTQWLFENSVRTTNPEELWKLDSLVSNLPEIMYLCGDT